jgi:hypothetical protein
MDKEEAITAGIRELQDANISLCNAYFTLDDHTNPGFNKEMDEVQSRIREVIGAIERLI